MRERSQTTPRRRRAGPKQALPPATRSSRSSHESGIRVGELESPYYSIDNTEDIYGTTLLPSQRCYVDPWDLENYDYVRKKIDDVTTVGGLNVAETDDYGHTLTTSRPTAATAAAAAGTGTSYGYGMSATMPRPHTQTRRVSRTQCQLECCMPRSGLNGYHRKEPVYTARSEIYGAPSRYDDYMATMTRQLHLDDEDDYEHGEVDEERERDQQDLYREEQRQLYNGYGGFSSASSTEQHSSIGGGSSSPLPRRAATLHRFSGPSQKINTNSNSLYGYGTAPHPRRKRSGPGKNSSVPQIDFPAPPPLSPANDYCNPYATLPYCSIPDCNECQYHATSLIYAAPSTLYGTLGGGRAKSQSPQSQIDSGDSSLYSGIYSRKFGLSKKGLLQIDYSCSWTDLDRVMGRQY
ncbi:uncharacterized protein LOC6643437 [Drosophila willistoni]|nr:uncharacterized protein LOC6643437 [Drosophila willistoni]